MATTLVVIWMHLANKHTGYFIQQYNTKQECEIDKRKVQSRTTRTWKYCITQL